MDDDRIGTGLYREPPDWLEGNVLLEQDARRKARAERQAAARRGLCGEENDDVRALLDGVVTLYFEFVVPSATHSWGAALRLEHQDLTVLSDLDLETEGFAARLALCFGVFRTKGQREWTESRVEACRAEVARRHQIARIEKELR